MKHIYSMLDVLPGKPKEIQEYPGIPKPPLSLTNVLLKLFNSCKAPATASLKPEARINIAFANRCKQWSLEGRLQAVWLHPSNEYSGDHSGAFGAIQTHMGRFPGIPDNLFLWSNGSGCIEFKAGKNDQSDWQLLFERWCKAMRVPYRLCYSADEGEAVLKEWGILLEVQRG